MIVRTRLLLMVIIIPISVLVVLGCEDNAELIDKLTTDNSQLQTSVTQLNIELAVIQAYLKELEVERDGLKKELSLLEEDRADVIEEHDGLKREIGVLEEDLAGVIGKRDELKREIGGIGKDLDDVIGKRDGLNREIGVLEEGWPDVIGKRDDLKKEIVVLDGKIADVKKIIARLERNIREGSEMALIPAGSFEMGDHFNEGEADELPVHRVELDAFYMDVNEVTVGQFKQFVEDSGYAYRGNWNDVAKYSPGDDYPMGYVNWNDATAYAKWAGKRLPTEAEWEYTARGGLVGKRYSWGDDKSVAREYANGAGIGGKDKWDRQNAPVGSFKPNGYGLYDMAGNVWEWCSDWYGSDYYSKSPLRNPQGPGSGSTRVLRGGSCLNSPSDLRAAFRNNGPPTYAHNLFGFRCVSGF